MEATARVYFKVLLADLPLRDQRFLLAMDGPDDGDEMPPIVRAMSLVEYYVEKALRQMFVSDQHIQMDDLAFTWKRKLAVGLGALPMRLSNPLKELANIRNQVAHDPESTLQDKAVDRLVNSLTESERSYFDVIVGDGGLYKHCSPAVRRLRCALTVVEKALYYATSQGI